MTDVSHSFAIEEAKIHEAYRKQQGIAFVFLVESWTYFIDSKSRQEV